MSDPRDRLEFTARAKVLLLVAAMVLAGDPWSMQRASAAPTPGDYANPIKPRMADGRVVESCADPSVLRGRGRYAGRWYMYCTAAINDGGTSSGAFVSRPLPMLVSRNLVNWSFVGRRSRGGRRGSARRRPVGPGRRLLHHLPPLLLDLHRHEHR